MMHLRSAQLPGRAGGAISTSTRDHLDDGDGPCRYASRALRKHIWRAVWLSAPLFVATAVAAKAQSAPDSSIQSSVWWLGAFLGAAHNSPVSADLGTTPGRDHLFFGLSARTSILRAGLVTISYCAQVLPLVVIRGSAPPSGYPRGTRATNLAVAVGFSPFGLDLAVPVGGKISIYGATAAGMLLFNQEYPLAGAGHIDFTLELGGGVRVSLANRGKIELGYRFHHLSNANSAAQNPGVDANVLYAGYEWAIHLRR
jgi:hypothetical protein